MTIFRAILSAIRSMLTSQIRLIFEVCRRTGRLILRVVVAAVPVSAGPPLSPFALEAGRIIVDANMPTLEDRQAELRSYISARRCQFIYFERGEDVPELPAVDMPPQLHGFLLSLNADRLLNFDLRYGKNIAEIALSLEAGVTPDFGSEFVIDDAIMYERCPRDALEYARITKAKASANKPALTPASDGTASGGNGKTRLSAVQTTVEELSADQTVSEAIYDMLENMSFRNSARLR